MNVLDHVSLGVTTIDDARRFYDPAMAELGLSCLAANEAFAAYGTDTVQFLVMVPADGQKFTRGNGTHIAFRADSADHVEEFYAAALDHGGTCSGKPGPRPEYPANDVFAAFVIDPFGHKLEAIHNGFNG
ncbi:VOC family protein [Erythrobacter sp. JK5]|uniref:VOC family protein n=1 Tax=Erythrobacter sp. JK5 TaxID=2829500 RepID=UPI001BAB2D73|nr:VOC family protein [Erythrobacter sp. JK5]QUL38984.1 VOC family protein [Erythrobacter sp. JK5]